MTGKLTLAQAGVNAPGTPMSMPFLPANNSLMTTLSLGVPSMTVTAGSLSPT